MSYGDYSGPDKPSKGLEHGSCNRQRCQATPALYYNHGSYAWYCADCARDIGQDPVNNRDWEMRWRPRCGHAQFETREEIDAREARIKTIDGQIEAVTGPIFSWPSRGPAKPQSESLKRMLARGRRRG